MKEGRIVGVRVGYRIVGVRVGYEGGKEGWVDDLLSYYNLAVIAR